MPRLSEAVPTLSDAAKIGWKDDEQRETELLLQLDHEDALDDGDPPGYTRVDTGSTFDYSSGYLDFTAGTNHDGLYKTDILADLPYMMEMEINLRTSTQYPEVGPNHAASINVSSRHLTLGSSNGIGEMFCWKTNKPWQSSILVGSQQWTKFRIYRDHLRAGHFTAVAVDGQYAGSQIEIAISDYGDGTGPFYIMFGGITGVQFWARNLKVYLGYDTGGEFASFVHDAGAGQVFGGFDLSNFAMPGTVASTNLKFRYSYDDGTPSMSGWLTLANLKLEGAIAGNKRYIRIDVQSNSDGDTQVNGAEPNADDAVATVGAGGGVIGGPNKRAGKQ